MNLLSSVRQFFAARRTRERRDPKESEHWWGHRTLAGVTVTPETALRDATVWACVRYLSSTVGQLPWRVMRELPNGGSEIARQHPTDAVLHWRTNPELSPFAFKETMIAWALLHGNGYAEIVRDGAGRVVELWPIHPERMQIRRDIETDALRYIVSDTAGQPQVELAPADVFHVRGFGNGPVGLSVVEHAAQSIGWSKAAETFGASFFGNGLNIGGFIEGAGGLTPQGMQRLRAELQQKFGGPRNAQKWMLLDTGMKPVKTSAAPNEAQFVETMQFQVETICRWFGVPPHKVMHLLRSTFNNIEHQAIEVVVDAVSPWVSRLEEEANFKLFGRNRMGFFTNIDMRGLLRGDNKSRAEYLRIMREVGAYSVNDIRRAEGDNPIGPEGDIRVVQGQYVPLDQVGQQQAPVPEPEPAAPEPQPETMAELSRVYFAAVTGQHHEA